MKRNLNWIYTTGETTELERRYDEWAGEYDEDLEQWGWSGPDFAVEIFSKYCAPEDPVLDVGAGTGLVGASLKQKGFGDVTGIDLSAKMLETARRKNAYRVLLKMELGKTLSFDSNRFGGVIGVGVFTLGHAPATAFDELVRVTRPGGHIALLMRPDVAESGPFKEKIQALEKAGHWVGELVSQPHQALPNEPDAQDMSVHVFRVLSAG